MESWIASRNVEHYRAMLARPLTPEQRRAIEQMLEDEMRKLAAAQSRPVDHG